MSIVEKNNAEPRETKGYALLIGVDDYRAFDSTGAQDLPGSVNDVMAWRSTLLRRGYDADNIRVLVSPVPGPLGPLGAQPATRANIERALAWLEEQTSDRDRTAGVLTFSGHGDTDADGQPVICPADTQVVDGFLEKTIRVSDIVYRLSRNSAVFLDCCHSGPTEMIPWPASLEVAKENARPKNPAGHAVLLSLRGRPGSAVDMKPLRDRPVQCRVLSATSAGGVAFQAEFMGRFQGALTWAVTSALGQWKALPPHNGGPASVTLSAYTARQHVEQMMASVEMPQTSELWGEPVATDALAKRIPLLGRGIEDMVSVDPDGRRVPVQFPVDLKVWFGTNINPATVGAAGGVSAMSYTPPTGYSRNREYWRLTDTFMNDITSTTSPASQIDFVVDTSASPPSWSNILTNPPKPLFWMDLVPTWTNCSPPNRTGYYTRVNDGKSPIAAVMFDLVRPENNGGRWGGSITWYRVVTTTTTGTAVFDSTGRSFVLSSGPDPSTLTMQWQVATFSPNVV
ncbi:MAG: caspase family protein [Polyangiaceae bacterium]